MKHWILVIVLILVSLFCCYLAVKWCIHPEEESKIVSVGNYLWQLCVEYPDKVEYRFYKGPNPTIADMMNDKLVFKVTFQR